VARVANDAVGQVSILLVEEGWPSIDIAEWGHQRKRGTCQPGIQTLGNYYLSIGTTSVCMCLESAQHTGDANNDELCENHRGRPTVPSMTYITVLGALLHPWCPFQGSDWTQ
jgi:hypothetical protein